MKMFMNWVLNKKNINPFTYPYNKWNKEIAQLLYANYE